MNFSDIPGFEKISALAKDLWNVDASSALAKLLKSSTFFNSFLEYLRSEHCEDLLKLWIKVQEISSLEFPLKREKILKYYPAIMGMRSKLKSSGIGFLQFIEPGNNISNVAEDSDNSLDPEQALIVMEAEAASFFKVLVSELFPRFAETTPCVAFLNYACEQVVSDSQFDDAVYNKLGDQVSVPSWRDNWLKLFVCLAKFSSSSIIISDMTERNTPIVFINEEFRKISGYASKEIVGRNLRFLQGPDTEMEAIEIMNNSINSHVDCQAQITYYSKNGDAFTLHLLMKHISAMDDSPLLLLTVAFHMKDLTASAHKRRQDCLESIRSTLPPLISVQKLHSGRVYHRNTVASVTPPKVKPTEVDSSPPNKDKHKRTKSKPVTTGLSKTQLSYRMSSYIDMIEAFTRVSWLCSINETTELLLSDGIAQEFLRMFCTSHSEMALIHLEFYWICQSIFTEKVCVVYVF